MASKARLGRSFQAFSNSRTIPSGRSISTFIKQIVPLALQSLYPIITQLRSREKEGREFPGELMNQIDAIDAIVLCFQSTPNLPRSKSRVRIPCPAFNLAKVLPHFCRI